MCSVSWKFKRVTDTYSFTEGPVWDREGVLFSDIANNRIMRYDPDTGTCNEHVTDTDAGNGLKLGPEGGLYACEMNGRRIVRYESDGSATPIASEYDGTRFNSPNDLWFDESGDLWFSDPLYATDWLTEENRTMGHESIYRCHKKNDGWADAERMTYDTTRPNGLLVSPDGTRLYVAQSKYDEPYCDGGKRELRAYLITDDGLGEYEVIHNFYPHRAVDGMCFDATGNIVACAGWGDSGPGPMIYVFEPDGRVIETHRYPGGNPTNCCFGGSDITMLYVTGSDGALYRAETDRVGYLTPP